MNSSDSDTDETGEDGDVNEDDGCGDRLDDDEEDDNCECVATVHANSDWDDNDDGFDNGNSNRDAGG